MAQQGSEKPGGEQATSAFHQRPAGLDYYLRHPEEPIPRSVREKMPASLLKTIRQERAGREMNSQRQDHPGAKRQEAAANLVMRADAGLTGVWRSSSSVGDVDGDGNLDLLITGTTGSGVSAARTATLYLGDGQGGFMEANANLTGVGRGSSSIADVDGDGNQDLLVTGSDENLAPTAMLYLGDGQGGFTEANAGLTRVEFGSTSIADVDGDGNLDLLITGQDKNLSPTTTLYLGDGQGGFSEAGADLAGVGSSSTSIADVDGDGAKDLLITGSDGNGNPTATLYLGDEQGEFTEAEAGLTGFRNGSVSSGDVNGDGHLDFLITGEDESLPRSPTATLYLGDGQGGFTEADASLTGVANGSTSIADVDGDGNLDLLITGFGANGPTATLYLGDGQGGFSEAGAGLTNVGLGGGGSSTSVADLQGDGDLDLLITGFGGLFREVSARVYINRQVQSPPNRAPTFARGFTRGRPLAPGVTLRRLVEAGDLDGDSLSVGPGSGVSTVSVIDFGNGTAEVAFTPTRSQGGSVAQPSVEVSDPDGGTGSFSTSIEVSPVLAAFSANLADVSVGSTSMGDVDGDENQDLLITGNSNSGPLATLYLGDGEGNFAGANAGLTGVKRSSTSIEDVDKDGNLDLLITGADENGNPTATLYLGDGQGGFTEAGADLSGVANGATSIADVDGDGNQDLLITGSGNATLYLGDGQGSFSEANAGLSGVSNGSTSIADVDGDGNQDLLITGSGNAILYLGNGEGGFSGADADLTGVRFSSTSIKDVDGDGNQDLLIAGLDVDFARTATLYLGDGQGGFSAADADLNGVGRSSVSIGDVNGDENQDLLITGLNRSLGLTATLYLGDGQGGFTEAGAGLTGVDDSSTSIADVDGDEDPDLLVTGFSEASQSRSTILYENLFDNPLPVELAGFEATADGDKVRLSWTTASETGNAGFRVQRRLEGRNGEAAWEQIGQVEGSGTTTEAKSYRFTDADLPYRADRLEYRLKQVDTDGSASYTDPVAVERTVDEVELLGTYPNPARGQTTVQYALPETQDVSIRLYDMLGREVRTFVSGEAEGRQEWQVDLSGLSSGTYFLRLQSEGETRTQKLTVVR